MFDKTAVVLLLGVLTVHGHVLDPDYYYDYNEYDYSTRRPDVVIPDVSITITESDDWWYDLVGDLNVCEPNPCLNGGMCMSTSGSNFSCYCPLPYTGRKCQRIQNVCQDAKCGSGDCVVNLKKAPFYECKCRLPFQGANCRSSSVCTPNPCQNGGSCVTTRKRMRCLCTNGYTGGSCEIAPKDCYTGNGEDYAGYVSVTETREECLNWNSYFVWANGNDAYSPATDTGNIGLGFHNYCRNPDGDDRPWCFIKRDGRLQWEHCNVRRCSGGLPTVPTPAPSSPSTPGFSQCGKPLRRGRIYGGSKSVAGLLPWQVSLQRRPTGTDQPFGHFCGGILIQSCWVLTAAHCISSNHDFQVVAGGVNILREESMDQIIPVEKTIMHQGYRMTTDALHNDIALLKLKVVDTPYCAKETDYVKTACLPDQPYTDGKECVVSGLGQTESAPYSSQLLSARVRLIPLDRCKSPTVYGAGLDNGMVCAGVMQGGIDSCSGDSGGPLVCERSGTHYATGVVSWGHGCAVKNKPGVYANVYEYVDWIKNNMK